jgi:hypothetical protein
MGGAGMSAFLGVMAVLALGGLVLLGRSRREDRQTRLSYDRDRRIHCAVAAAFRPGELTARIFSREDRDYIRRTGSSALEILYLRERRKVASHWVRQVSEEVGWIMREHRLRSRQSANLSVIAESKLFFYYAELKLLCGLMLVLVRIFGPHALVDLAARAGELYQRIGRSLPDVLAALGSIEPSRNPAA